MTFTEIQQQIIKREDLEYLGIDKNGKPVVLRRRAFHLKPDVWAIADNGDPRVVKYPVIK